jgi:DNA repair exonuclease SbcCD nuclease subunit
MLTAIITDQHFGCRKNSKLFHDYFLNFYNDVFFPTLEQYGITTIIDLGDTFDNRKTIDFAALEWAKTNYYDRLKSMGCTVYTVVGNHTSYYKNSNSINAVDLLLREYSNVRVISDPTVIDVGDLPILFVPWINQENEEKTFKIFKNPPSKIAMGHLELAGFSPYKGHIMQEGYDKSLFDNFDLVFSGHYHTRSNNKKIFYLGNPYEIYWNDVDDARGFHLFDTESLKLTPVNNPYRMFYQVYYDETDVDTLNFSDYTNKIVKLIVRKKTDNLKFEKFVDQLYSSDIAELKIVENFSVEKIDHLDEFESEHTMSIVTRYIEESTTDLEKSKLKRIFQRVYKQACELV